MSDSIGRRDMLKQTLFFGAAAALGSSLVGCGGGALECNNLQGVSPEDVATRTSNAYVDATADPSKKCSGCQFWQGRGDNACGGCQVVKGPINPNGNCRLWVAKTT